ncbi:MAG TPA: hypothetical protein VM120_15910 [Bryobacteraceae bacterium]|nr:hypothetical protein [Bryobacteraceae bacterium]
MSYVMAREKPLYADHRAWGCANDAVDMGAKPAERSLGACPANHDQLGFMPPGLIAHYLFNSTRDDASGCIDAGLFLKARHQPADLLPQVSLIAELAFAPGFDPRYRVDEAQRSA